MSRPLCYVLLPALPDFDRVYRDLIEPAVEQAGLQPWRSSRLEDFVLTRYAVTDLTLADESVYYHLGVREAARPRSTVLLAAEGKPLPFELCVIRYQLGAESKSAIAQALLEAQQQASTGSFVHLADGIPKPILAHTRTDIFREQVHYSERWKQRLAQARTEGAAAVRAVQEELGNIAGAEPGVAIDLLLSYRALKAWKQMIALVDQMSPPLASTLLVREQLAFAWDRIGDRDRAERILLELIATRGPDSETYALLGRVYKDAWEDASHAGDSVMAGALLDKAIHAYLSGFEADWRDAYPGINAVTLMEVRDPPEDRRTRLLPVVRYAVERRIAAGKPDYWDYAALLELAVLEMQESEAERALEKALRAVRESWEPETTARNLRLILEAKQRRGSGREWMARAGRELLRRV